MHFLSINLSSFLLHPQEHLASMVLCGSTAPVKQCRNISLPLLAQPLADFDACSSWEQTVNPCSCSMCNSGFCIWPCSWLKCPKLSCVSQGICCMLLTVFVALYEPLSGYITFLLKVGDGTVWSWRYGYTMARVLRIFHTSVSDCFFSGESGRLCNYL